MLARFLLTPSMGQYGLFAAADTAVRLMVEGRTMSAPIGVGDWVRCIDASPAVHPRMGRLELGRAYQIRALVEGKLHGVGEMMVGLDLTAPETQSCFSPGKPDGWRTEWFEILYRPSQSLFLTRLLDVPAPEPVDA